MQVRRRKECDDEKRKKETVAGQARATTGCPVEIRGRRRAAGCECVRRPRFEEARTIDFSLNIIPTIRILPHFSFFILLILSTTSPS